MAETFNDDQLVHKAWIEIENSLKRLQDIWHQAGFDEEIIQKYRNDALKHILALTADMETEATERNNEYIECNNKMLHLIKTLSHELEIEVELPKFQTETLVQIDAILRTKLKELDLIKENRMSQARVLLKKERQICEYLGLQPTGFKSSIPNSNELKDFEVYLSKKEVELTSLETTFKDLRRSIIKMMEEMNYTPRLEFERLVCHDHENFIYSSSNMNKLNHLHDTIKDELNSMKEQVDKKRQELLTLWTYLEIPKEKYEEFLTKHSRLDVKTIDALNKEIRRCVEIRKVNMSKFIGKVREELKNWWDICKLSTKEREAFRFFNSELYTEDMLKLHEIEVERLRQFYEDNHKLYELLDKREEMWDQKKEYQRQTENPDRYHNRGGQLLAEEKARKYLNKNFPKVEEQLMELVQDFEKKNKRVFTIYGLKLDDYFAKQLEDFEKEMEKLKAAKLKSKEEKSAKKTPLSTSRRNLAYASIRGANTSIKRKNCSPAGGRIKSARLANSENLHPKSQSKLRRSRIHNKVAARKLNLSSNKSINNPRTPTISNSNKTEVVTVDSSTNETRAVQQYEEFQEHLINREELRSTLLNEVHVKRNLKKPVKTPVKPSRKYFSPRTPLKNSKIRNSTVIHSPKVTSTPKLAAAPSTSIQNIF